MVLLAWKKDTFELGTDLRGKGRDIGEPEGRSYFQAHAGGGWQDSAPVVERLLPLAVGSSCSSSSSLFGAPRTSLHLLLPLLSLPGCQSLATESFSYIFAGLLWKLLRFYIVIEPVTEHDINCSPQSPGSSSKPMTSILRVFDRGVGGGEVSFDLTRWLPWDSSQNKWHTFKAATKFNKCRRRIHKTKLTWQDRKKPGSSA